MVKTELGYNPYIKETTVVFNGQKPRVNSLVEKYQDFKLIEWVKKIPQIFRDEMNGYDFELDFSGTDLDFEELRQSFRDAGVKEDQVQIFHKKDLESREVKVKRIDDLLKWLDENPNRNFDEETFRKENRELFEGAYNFIIIHGGVVDDSLILGKDISIENINDVKELKGTKLSSTPVLFCLDRETIPLLQADLGYIIGLPGVIPDQLFFWIDPELDQAIAYRIVQDLGIREPQIVGKISEDSIVRYMQLYPVTDYICESIRMLREKTALLEEKVRAENEENAATNQNTLARISEIDSAINKAKLVYEEFKGRDNIEMPASWIQTKNAFVEKITTWRNRKTKIVKDDEAYRVSREFQREFDGFYNDFLRYLNEEIRDSESGISEEYGDWYREAEAKDAYEGGALELELADEPETPFFADDLLKLKEESMVEVKDTRESLLGFIFGTPADRGSSTVPVTTYYYQKWREYVLSVVEPMVNELLFKQYDLLRTYANEKAEAYEAHLEEIMNGLTEKKTEASSQLSEKQQLSQIDNDWLVAFNDQLNVIERG